MSNTRDEINPSFTQQINWQSSNVALRVFSRFFLIYFQDSYILTLLPPKSKVTLYIKTNRKKKIRGYIAQLKHHRVTSNNCNIAI